MTVESASKGLSLAANVRMYAVTDEADAAWCRIIEWLSQQTGVALQLVDYPPPAPLAGLWSRSGLGCVAMCGWPIAQAKQKPQLLAAPVPLLERYKNRAIYYSDLIVRKDSPFESLIDTFGGTLGWTLEDSNSGFNMLRHHLLQHRTTTRDRLYSRSIGHLINPLGSLRAVAEGLVDVAPVDSFCHDLFKAANHPYTEYTRTIETTEPSPMPALVASADVSDEIADRLRSALLDAHNDSRVAQSLHGALIRRFERPDMERYQYTENIARDANDAGYPIPA